MSEAGAWPRPHGVIDAQPDLLLPSLNCNPALLAYLVFGGVFGLDRLYYGDTYGALLKLLSLGVLPGFWWIWDAVQIVFEHDETVRSGLKLPFDFKSFGVTESGLGTGRFVSKTPWVSTVSPFYLGILMMLPLGFDAYYRRDINLFIRRIVEFVMFFILLNWLISWSSSFFVFIPALFFFLILLLVVPPWGSDLYAVAKGFTDGIQYSKEGEPIWFDYPYTNTPEMKFKNFSAPDMGALFHKAHPNEAVTATTSAMDPQPAIEHYKGTLDTIFIMPFRLAFSAIASVFVPGYALNKAVLEARETPATLLNQAIGPQRQTFVQRGGGLGTESMVMGATVAALIAGGALKGLIDYTVHQ